MAIPYVVVLNDFLVLIAKKFGIADWRTIYNDPANAAFRAKRPDPNHIFAGDVIMIPISAPSSPAPVTPAPSVIVPVPPPPLLLRVRGRVAGIPVARSSVTAGGADQIEVKVFNRLPLETWVTVSVVATAPSGTLRDHKMLTLKSLASDTARFLTIEPPPIRWDVSIEIIRTPSTSTGGLIPGTSVSAPGLVDFEVWM